MAFEIGEEVKKGQNTEGVFQTFKYGIIVSINQSHDTGKTLYFG